MSKSAVSGEILALFIYNTFETALRPIILVQIMLVNAVLSLHDSNYQDTLLSLLTITVMES